ncbi:phosphatidylserine decarboxylase [Pseudenhygromyxa sp. WMMC2535]|uniref:archaetidylserine decarboxylase n=1 Tax=Pseudenhygromyxa sp. WMMC2535 TaxID=2712867 RepID=UPI001594EC16|nr:archaetidylserine decarboxylase [Pseudenhygromyxa sp. WMMC2535]NVB42092.1 phosphatidylserine decarboxylase [Pseudenhygromyxa sp. WMMC2535]
MRSSDLSWRDRLAVALVERTPPRSAMAASQALGAAARLPLPRAVSRAAVSTYARIFDVDLGEVDPGQLAEGFGSFDAFFTRSLREGARQIDKRPEVLVSPCDGRLREISEIEAQGVVIAKGYGYAIDELIADAAMAKRFVGGLQTVIYLHPRDYHRVHVPFSGVAKRLTLVPGRMLPVTDASVAAEPRLFAVNERAVHLLETDAGMVAVVMVAAFGVGHMSCDYRDVEAHPEAQTSVDFSPPPFLAKGDGLGVFHLGSTVVLLCEPGFEAAPGLTPGDRLRFGQPLLTRAGGAE